MSTPKRHGAIPGTYFVTSRTWEGRLIFKTAPPCEIFVESLLRYRDKDHYRLHAFVLMTDHFHILVTPGDATTLERAVQFIKGGSAHEITQRLAVRFPVWQRGFSDHRIRDQQDYDKHLYYLLQNPVKRNLSASAREFKWSSASELHRMDAYPQGLKPLADAASRHG
ncbi:MAG TPA: transposase [Candidatus Acidoferrales bacterium]